LCVDDFRFGKEVLMELLCKPLETQLVFAEGSEDTVKVKNREYTVP
jgi:hypothetical protein